TTFSAATDSLVARGVVTHRRWFGLVARVGRYDRSIKAGYYELKRGSSARTVLRTLSGADERSIRFTVPEGFTIADIAQAADRQLGVSADSVKAAARDPLLVERFGSGGPDLEGFLLPETYFLSKATSGRGLVYEM